MIALTRLNHQEVWVNPSHIVTVESTPDTLVTLFGGEKLMVRESPGIVCERIAAFLKQLGWVPLLIRRQSVTDPEES